MTEPYGEPLTPNSPACIADQYEGDIDGFIDHLVNDHAVPEDYFARYRRCVDQSSWSVIANWHGAIMQGRYIPRHRRPGMADLPPDYSAWDYSQRDPAHRRDHRGKFTE